MAFDETIDNSPIQRVTVVGEGGQPSGNKRYTNITSATTTVVKASAGFLHRIVINKPVASATWTLYDSTSAAGTKIATITLPATLLSDGPKVADFDGVRFSNGLTVVTAEATDSTVVWS